MTTGSFLVVFEGPTLSKNQPHVMNVLASEFRFSPDATNLEDADFVAHRKIVNIDYLRKQQASGLYDNVETLAEKAQPPEYTTLDEKNNDNIYLLKMNLRPKSITWLNNRSNQSRCAV